MTNLNKQLDEYADAIAKLADMRSAQLEDTTAMLKDAQQLNRRLKAELQVRNCQNLAVTRQEVSVDQVLHETWSTLKFMLRE